jgi:hypothetical protein
MLLIKELKLLTKRRTTNYIFPAVLYPINKEMRVPRRTIWSCGFLLLSMIFEPLDMAELLGHSQFIWEEILKHWHHYRYFSKFSL